MLLPLQMNTCDMLGPSSFGQTPGRGGHVHPQPISLNRFEVDELERALRKTQVILRQDITGDAPDELVETAQELRNEVDKITSPLKPIPQQVRDVVVSALLPPERLAVRLNRATEKVVVDDALKVEFDQIDQAIEADNDDDAIIAMVMAGVI